MTDVAERIEETARELVRVAAVLRRATEIEAARRQAREEFPEIASGTVRAVIAARHLREQWFDPALGEADWSILLQALAVRLEGRTLGLSELGEAAGLAKTTAHSAVNRLAARGLLVRRAHPEDERIALIDLTDEAADRLRAYLRAAFSLSPWILIIPRAAGCGRRRRERRPALRGRRW